MKRPGQAKKELSRQIRLTIRRRDADRTKVGKLEIRTVKKSKIPDQYHFFFIFNGKITIFLDKTFLGNCQYSHSLLIHFFTNHLCFDFQGISQGMNLPVELGIGTDIENLFYAPLVMICRFPCLSSITTDILLRVKSKGISSTLV